MKNIAVITALILLTSCSTIRGMFASEEDKEIDAFNRDLEVYEAKTVKSLREVNNTSYKRVKIPTLPDRCYEY